MQGKKIKNAAYNELGERLYTIYRAIFKETGKTVYIGFTKQNPHRRVAVCHLSDAYSDSNRKKQPLHQAIFKYGWNAFEWEVIFQSTNEWFTHEVMEDFYMEIYRTKTSHNNGGYNVSDGGSKPPKLYKHLFKHDRTVSCETKNKIAETLSYKEYIFIDPTGKIIKTKNLTKFCKENNLNAGNMYQMLLRQIPSHCNGYRPHKNEYINVPFIEGKVSYYVQDPLGKIHHITHILNFCKQNNLNYTSFMKAIMTRDKIRQKHRKSIYNIGWKIMPSSFLNHNQQSVDCRDYSS